MRFCLSAIILSLFWLGNAYAQADNRGVAVVNHSSDSGVKGNTYAIIIGISNYKNVSHLQFADRDAQAFLNYLVSDAGGKIPRDNIEPFINEDATRTNIGDAISEVVKKAKAGDRVYFFFAGHGDMEDLTQIENGLLLLYNSPNGNYFGMNDDVLEILDLKRYLSPLSQRGIEMFFIIDACHSGNLKGGVQGIEQTASALAASWGKEFKLLSCQPNQLSQENKAWGGGRGLFSLELEEGLKGLADKNSNGKVSLLELQDYLTNTVSAMSEDQQIPLISGDLTKTVAVVNPSVLATLKKEKEGNRPTLGQVNTKGILDEYIDTLDEASKKLYNSFEKNLEDRKLISPEDENAIIDYRLFENKNPDNQLTHIMKRNLEAALNEKFDSIVAPLLNGETSYSSREECEFASRELDSCLNLMGEQHYMYHNIKARKLYMNAMSLTWALTESEYNIGLKAVVKRSVNYLEESEELEPNAAYTISALGTRYYYLYDYKKAFEKFQKYIDLRPNDFYAKYSLADLFAKLGEYEKAEALLKELVAAYPEYSSLYVQLCKVYFDDNKRSESLLYAKKLLDSAENKTEGYFQLGVYYQKAGMFDSSKYYYELCRASGAGNMIDNNIGYSFLVNQNIDSALFYLSRLYKADSTFPYVNFNLATIDMMRENYGSAIDKFINTINYSNSSEEAFVSNSQMYYNKKYNVTDSSEYNNYKKKVFAFNLQYLSYLSIFYCYLRDPELFTSTDKIRLIFSRLKNYSQYNVYTYYHYACYQSLKKNKTSALDNLHKSLQLGFGNYFMLTSDADLDFIRSTPEFTALLKQYFPDKVK